LSLTAASAEELLRAMRFDDPRSWASMPGLCGSEIAVEVAERLLSQQPEGALLWAALEVYAAGGERPEPFRSYLSHDDSAIRLMAADALLARGDPAGFPVLVEGLSDPEAEATGGRFLERDWEMAAIALVRRTGLWRNGPPLDARPEQIETAHGRWNAWLEEAGEDLAYDADHGEWSAT
jgi:HEAT repeat protein